MNQDLNQSLERLSLSPRLSQSILTQEEEHEEKKEREEEKEENRPKKKIILSKKIKSPRIIKSPKIIKQLTFQSDDEPIKFDEKSALEDSIILANKRKNESLSVHELKKFNKELDVQKDDQKKIKVVLQPHRKYPEEMKRRALELSEKMGVAEVSSKTGIPESSLRRWRKIGVARVGMSGRRPQYMQLEAELLELFKFKRSKSYAVTNKDLIKEAKQLAASMGLTDFSGSMSWPQGFKTRHCLCYRKATRVSQKLKATAIEDGKRFQEQIGELIAKHHYPPAAIVNADETAIYFDCPASYTLDFKVIY